jgi:phosphoribosylformimino-5-aminoimidazole carboxamide ribotide isomerase
MEKFDVYPAIDLRDGQVVRLQQGQIDRQQVYSRQPQEVAQVWADQGAVWLHIVNLNGAFGEATQANKAAIREIIAALKGRVCIQLGGGIRSLAGIQAVLELGVDRVVLGTAVMENPDFAREVLAQFPAEKIAFGLDAKGEELMSRGWRSKSGLRLTDLALELAGMGAQTLIYTNIQKDGMQSGVDWKAARQLAGQSGLSVIASGGVATLEDVAAVRHAGLAGVIVGKALYEGNFTLKEALDVR